MESKDVIEFSVRNTSSAFSEPCEGHGEYGGACTQRGYYITDPMVTPWPYYLCEDHIVEFASGEELALLCGMGYYR